jgi:hypothetical protein
LKIPDSEVDSESGCYAYSWSAPNIHILYALSHILGAIALYEEELFRETSLVYQKKTIILPF